MLNSALFVRPWSGHVPKVAGYEPTIRCKIERVGKGKRNAWRSTIYVADRPMSFS
jgi:hypothetical protein